MNAETDMLAQMRSRHLPRPGSEAKALDAWMRTSLGRTFDDTLVAAVPEDLAALVARFAQ
jgi:hypothetical protein